MQIDQTVIGMFSGHEEAENAVKKLAQAGYDMRSLSVVGKGYHTDEKVVGFYNMGDRMQFWGLRGAFWGALWSLFFGGIFLTVPVVGPVIVLGYFTAAAVAAIEGAAVVGGLSALGAALYSLGMPKDSVIRYEASIEADGFLVMAHGSDAEMQRAKAILSSIGATDVESHPNSEKPAAAAIAL